MDRAGQAERGSDFDAAESFARLAEDRNLIEYPHDATSVLGLIGGFFEPQTAMTVKKPTCAICEFTMRKIDAMLKDNRTAEAIEKTVAKACNILPSGVQVCSDRTDIPWLQLNLFF